ncbi:MAG TPA: hypothetical protein EYQ50_22620 [Verrucomicrobiales bacterium]|nr:hypothetical protein [Verrucomicrobiales bacterium]
MIRRYQIPIICLFIGLSAVLAIAQETEINLNPLPGFEISFERERYDIVPGQPFETKVLISPIPGNGLFSFGFSLSHDPDPLLVEGTVIHPDLDFNAVRGAPAITVIEEGRVGLKGTVDFSASPKATYFESLLATFIIVVADDSTDPVTLTLSSNRSLGPEETLFVDGFGISLDPQVVFGETLINRIPAAVLSLPLEGAEFQEGETIAISVEASDSDGSVTLVEFFVDGVKIGEKNEFPYEIQWKPPSKGSYEIGVSAIDNLGAVSGFQSHLINVVVSKPNFPPEVVLIRPNNETKTPVGAPYLIHAVAEDLDGSISYVRFLLNEQEIGRGVVEPYQLEWIPDQVSDFNLVVEAVDDLGGIERSDSVLIHVVPMDQDQAPVISLVTPTSGNRFFLENRIVLSARAWDPVGQIREVEYFVNGELFADQELGTAQNSPFELTWNILLVGVGTFKVRGVAKDNTGNQTVSDEVEIRIVQGNPQIGILNSSDRPEHTVLQAFLAEMNLLPRMLSDAGLVSSDLNRLELLIIARSNDDHSIPGKTIIDQIRTYHIQGNPVFFIGENLHESASGLGLAAEESWRQLVGVKNGKNATERDSESLVPIAENILNQGPYGRVLPFDRLALSSDRTQLSNEMVPSILFEDLPLAGYREGSESGVGLVTQLFPVHDFQDAYCNVQREKLFKNSIHFLLNQGPPLVESDLEIIAEDFPESIKRGEIRNFRLRIRHQGEIDNANVHLSARFPESVFIETSTDGIGRILQNESGKLVQQIGYLFRSDEITLEVQLIPTRGGAFPLVFEIGGIPRDSNSSNNRFQVILQVEEGVVSSSPGLVISRIDERSFDLILDSQSGVSFQLETSEFLFDPDWKFVKQGVLSNSTEVILPSVTTEGFSGYYRVKLIP